MTKLEHPLFDNESWLESRKILKVARLRSGAWYSEMGWHYLRQYPRDSWSAALVELRAENPDWFVPDLLPIGLPE